jgi:hypothetical protein
MNIIINNGLFYIRKFVLFLATNKIFEVSRFIVTLICFMTYLSMYFINKKSNKITSSVIDCIILFNYGIKMISYVLFGYSPQNIIFAISEYCIFWIILYTEEARNWKKQDIINKIIILIKYGTATSIITYTLQYINFIFISKAIMEHNIYTIVNNLTTILYTIIIYLFIKYNEKEQNRLKNDIWIILNNIFYAIIIIINIWYLYFFRGISDIAKMLCYRNISIQTLLYILILFLISIVKNKQNEFTKMIKMLLYFIFSYCILQIFIVLYINEIFIDIKIINNSIPLYILFTIGINISIHIILKIIDKKDKKLEKI